MRKAVGEPHAQHVHFGATSQDVVDTSLVLRLKPALEQIEHEIAQVTAGLTRLAGAWSPKRLNGHTRMQTALPISVGDKIRNWTRPLQDAAVALEALRPRLLRLQFGGAVGTLDKLGESGKDVSDALAAAVMRGMARRDMIEITHVLPCLGGTAMREYEHTLLMRGERVSRPVCSEIVDDLPVGAEALRRSR